MTVSSMLCCRPSKSRPRSKLTPVQHVAGLPLSPSEEAEDDDTFHTVNHDDLPSDAEDLEDHEEEEIEDNAAQSALFDRIVQGSLSDSERGAVTVLLGRVADLVEAAPHQGMDINVAVAIRFLRARKLNVPAAESMLRDSVKWRHEFELTKKCTEWRQELAEGKTVAAKVMKAYWFAACSGRDLQAK